MTDRDSGEGFAWGLTPGGTPDPVEPPELVEPPARLPAPSLPTEPPEPRRAAEPDPTELLVAASAAAAAAEPMHGAPALAAEPGSALDALFGEERFQEYEDGLDPAQRPRPPGRTGTRVATRGAHTNSVSGTQKVMISVSGALVALLALFALFILGTRLPTILHGEATAAVSSPAASRTPSATPTPVTTSGPLAVGVHPWDALRGGECLNPYTGPWAETFTVVDCAAAHPAQLVFRGAFDPATVAIFPGADALQAQISVLCGAPGVLNLAAAGAYADAQLQGSYPVTEKQWAAGQHDYFCFVSRSSGQPLTGSVAAPR